MSTSEFGVQVLNWHELECSMMSAIDTFLFVCALMGAMSVFFVLMGILSDFVWPWIANRPRRPQATYLTRSGKA